MNSKALAKGAVKVSLVLLLLVVAGVFVLKVWSGFGQEENAYIWTTDTNGEDKTDFSPEEIVYIHGTDFSPLSNVSITITIPDGSSFTDSNVTDENGSFLYQYDLNGMIGIYTVDADDGNGNVAQTFFTDHPDFKTYENAGCTVKRYIFAQGSTVYTKATWLYDDHGYKFEWRDTSDSVVRTSTCLYGSNSYTDSYTLSGSATPGTWKIKLIDYGRRDSSCSNPSSSFTQIRYNVYTGTLLTPTDDSYVRQCDDSTSGEAAKTHDDNIHVKWKNAGPSCSPDKRRSYLKFDLSGIPDNAIITSAKLHLYRYEGEAEGETIGSYYVSDDTWTESGITWNNAPAMGSQMSSTAVGPDDGGYIWDVTSQVSSEITGDDILSVGLKFAVESKTKHQDFCDRELTGDNCNDVQGPYLEIVYTLPTTTTTTTTTTLPPTHAECSNGQCIIVQGGGPDLCSIDSDCYHKECQNMQCVQVNEYPDKSDTCSIDDDCFYWKCDYQQVGCVKAPGNLADQCSENYFVPDCAECVQDNSDCKQFDLQAIATCFNTPDDSLDFTWDTHPFVDSTCDKSMEPWKCTRPEYGDVTNVCDKATCKAECDSNDDCQPYIGQDNYCYINGQCDTDPTKCTCSWTQDGYCPVPGTVVDGTCYYGERSCTKNGCGLSTAPMDCNDVCDPLLGPVDKTGPTTSNLVAKKVSEQCKINIEATETDTCSNIAAAEYFLGGATCGDPGTGDTMNVKDGNWDELIEDVIANNIIVSDGSLNIHVRGKDAAGNWGPCMSIRIDIDCIPPDCPTNMNVNGGTTEVLVCGNNPTLGANICDSQTRIQAAEYFIDTDNPLNWHGIPMDAVDGAYDKKCEDVQSIIDISQLSEGTHYVKLHGKDGQENWGKFDYCPVVSFVKDTTKPKTTKSVSDPKHACEKGENCDWYITQNTEITLTCYDFNPDDNTNDGYNDRPGQYSNDVTIYWRYRVDGGSWQEFNHNGNEVKFKFPEDTTHELEYWCSDACGNVEDHHYETDIVDTQKPNIVKSIVGPSYGVCPPQSETDVCFITTIHVESTDPEPHPVNHVTCDWDYTVSDGTKTGSGQTGVTPPFDINFPEESTHILTITCRDALGNEETDVEKFIVDKTAPTTTKTYGTPRYPDDIYHAKWITSQTQITLTVDDTGPHKSGIKETKYRVTLLGSDEPCESQSACDAALGSGDWQTYSTSFTIGQESCHLIEYYSVDNVDKTEVTKKQCVYVENTPPVIDKAVDTPKHECTKEEWLYYNDILDDGQPDYGCYYITSGTKITLNCYDVAPHPVDQVALYWRNYLTGETPPSYTVDADGYAEIYKTPDSEHVLEFYCEDALGNTNGIHKEVDIVDNQAPESSKNLGTPQHACELSEQNQYYDPLHNPAPTDGCYFITKNTPVTITCQDKVPHPVDHVKIYYRTYFSGDQNPPAFTEDSDSVTFYYPQDSAHVLEWYCVDELGNQETTHVEYDIVDTQAPEGIKEVGSPKIPCEPPKECDYWVRDKVTTITLNCVDPNPHPVDHEKMCYKISFDNPQTPWLTSQYCTQFGGTMEGNWCCVDKTNLPYIFTFQEDSSHDLEYYCVDALENKNQEDVEYFKVDSTPPVTTKQYLGPFYTDGTSDWIDTASTVQLTAVDGGDVCHVDGTTTYYRYTLVDDEDCRDKSKCVPQPDGSWYIYEKPFGISEESCHLIEFYSVDALGNIEDVKYQCVFVDKTPPVTTKNYVGSQYPNPITDQTPYPHWITSATEVHLSAQDPNPHPSGVKATYYRDVYLPNSNDWHYCFVDCGTWSPDHPGDWTLYTGPFYKPEESCHIIEYYSVDNVDKTEPIKWQCVFVDNTPPVLTKVEGDPKVPCDPQDPSGCVYWVRDHVTPIDLYCSDLGDHPVDHVNLWYRILLDGQVLQDWIDRIDEVHKQIIFNEDSVHTLEYYCVDALGNSEGTRENPHRQVYRVDSTPPESNKTIGDPKWWDESLGLWWVTSDTQFTLTAVDKQDPCAVGVAGFRVKIEWDSNCDGTVDTTIFDQDIPEPYQYSFTLNEECLHKITWFAFDKLGNTEQVHEQYHKVDNTPPHVLILKPVDGWYSDGEDIPIVALAEDLSSPPCDPLSKDCAVGIEDGKECNAYLIDLLPEFKIVKLESHLKYNASAHECQGYATIPSPSNIPDGVVILAVSVSDRLGNEGDSIREIERMIEMRCECEEDGEHCPPPCIADVIQDIVTIWNLPKIGIDNHAPKVTITSPQSDTMFGGEQVFVSADVIDANDGEVTSTITSGTPCYITIGNVSLGTVPYDNENRKCQGIVMIPQDEDFPQGDQELRVEIADNAGNIGSDAIIVTVDTVKPVLDIIQPSQNQFVKDTVTINFSVFDSYLNASNIMVSTDNGQTWRYAYICGENYCYNWDTTKETDGMAYGIIAKATDDAGNTGYSEMVIVIVDNGAPEGVYMMTPIKDEIVSGTITLKALATDYVSGVQNVRIYVNNGPWYCDATLVGGTWQCSLDSTTLPDGQHNAYAVATDNLGHQTTSASVPFIIDNHPPEKPELYVNDPDGDGYDTDGTVTWYWNESNDEGSGIDYYVIDITYSESPQHIQTKVFGTTFTYSDLADGTWRAKLKAVDKAGHESEWSDLVNITVDKTKPSPVSISSSGVENPPYDTDGSYVISWGGGSDTNFDRYELYENDTKTYSGSSNNMVFTDKPDGTYEYYVVAYDKARWTSTSSKLKVTVDKQAPTIQIIGTAPGIGFFIATYSVNDAEPSSGIDRIEASSNGYALCSGTIPAGFCTVFLGSELNLTVYDKAGNSGTASTTGQEKDITPPTITYSSPSGVINYNNITLEVRTDESAQCYYGTEDNVSSMVEMDSDAGKLIHTADLGVLTDGLKVYHVICEDLSENWMDSSKTIVFYIDTSGNYNLTIPDYGHYWSTGWNTFWLPQLILNDICGIEEGQYKVEDVLSSLYNLNDTTNFDIIWYFDGTEWLYFMPEHPEYSTLQYFNDQSSLPYYIHMTAEDRLEITQDICPPTIPTTTTIPV
jgi:hypothetical protein